MEDAEVGTRGRDGGTSYCPCHQAVLLVAVTTFSLLSRAATAEPWVQTPALSPGLALTPAPRVGQFRVIHRGAALSLHWTQFSCFGGSPSPCPRAAGFHSPNHHNPARRAAAPRASTTAAAPELPCFGGICKWGWHKLNGSTTNMMPCSHTVLLVGPVGLEQDGHFPQAEPPQPVTVPCSMGESGFQKIP